MLRLKAYAFLLLFLCLFWGRAGWSREAAFPVFRDDLDRDSLRRAIHRSLEFLQRVPPERPVGEWPRKVTAREIKESLLLFLERLDLLVKPQSLIQFLRSHYDLHRSDGRGASGSVLFTGYYQPVISGSLVETEEFRFPIYGKPKDLVETEVVRSASDPRVEKLVGRLEDQRLVPYFSRHEIDGLGLLKGKGYELAWVKDPVELFFLHIQGSGLLRLKDGRLLPLNYAASNGRPYASIGRLLVESGKIPRAEINMQRLRRYLKDHPEDGGSLMARNESYVFFRLGEDGPLGSLEVPLTPGRSIATDPRIFPKAALGFVISRRPVPDAQGKVIRWRPFSRFVLNQDSGSAIQGPGRVDLYFGSGPEAGWVAGAMNTPGKLYFLIPKSEASP